MITLLIVGATKDPTDKRKQIFSECVHIAIDIHFSGDDILHYLGEGGWKGTMTCRCNRLPKSVSRKYFNFIKEAPVNAGSKVARFEQPIIAVNHVKHQDSDRVTDKKDYALCLSWECQQHVGNMLATCRNVTNFFPTCVLVLTQQLPRH
jgi:hypothetical protein